MKINDEKMNGNNNYKYKNDYNKNKFRSKKDYKEYNNNYYHHYSNDDNKSTDFSSKKSYHS